MDSKGKGKGKDCGAPTCDYCGEAGAANSCSRCQVARYCDRKCQVAHWKGGHKQLCVTPHERKPQVFGNANTKVDAEAVEEEVSDICCICCMPVTTDRCILPCGHKYHAFCVKELRKRASEETCPQCREKLPPNPESVYDSLKRIHTELTKALKRHHGLRRRRDLDGKVAELVEKLTQIAKQGLPEAQLLLGKTYETGDLLPMQPEKAMEWYTVAAECPTGNTKSSSDGIESCSVDGCEHCSVDGIEHCSVDEIAMNAIYRLGMLHLKNQSEEKAFEHFLRAAKLGSHNAQFQTALAYSEGEGVQTDLKKTMYWYKLSADQGNSSAQINLASHYNHTDEFKDLKEAVRYYKMAVEQEQPDAQYSLAYMYYRGVVVDSQVVIEKNDEKAFELFQAAAKNGQIEAQHNMGHMLVSGEGVEKNVKKGLIAIEQAAEDGLCHAQLYLGNMYLRKNDKKKAKHWFKEAAKQGSEEAIDKLRLLEKDKESA